MIVLCSIWCNATALVLLAEVAKRDRPPFEPGLFAGLAPALVVAVAVGPLKAAALMALIWVCAQGLCLGGYMLVMTWRSRNRSILPWAPDPFDVACMKRVDRFYRPGLARAAVMSTLLLWASTTITEEEIDALDAD